MLSTFRPARAALSDYAKLQAEHAALKSHFHESEKLQSVLEQDRQRHCKIILSQLPPKPLDESARYVCRSLSVEDAKYAFLSRQFQSSIVGHGLRLGSDLWCDPARVSVTRIEELVHPRQISCFMRQHVVSERVKISAVAALQLQASLPSSARSSRAGST